MNKDVTPRKSPSGEVEFYAHDETSKMEERPRSERAPLRTRITALWGDEGFVANFYFVSWFTLNVVITLYSKAAFSIIKFPYPMLMTCIHMVFTALGCQICAWAGLYKPATLSRDGWKTVLWFSLIFTANIWLSNASLMMVSVNLHQVVRTTIPLFTMATSLLVFREVYPIRLLPSVLIVIAGVAVTAWGNMDTTAFGLAAVFLGCFLSSLKGILTQKTQMGSSGLSSLDLLRLLSPMATIQLLFVDLFQGRCVSPLCPNCVPKGELSDLIKRDDLSWTLILHLVVNGLIAFFLNFTSFRWKPCSVP
eukprot:Polyplicarium_translucidae@DN3086_c0_g1_i7.p1